MLDGETYQLYNTVKYPFYCMPFRVSEIVLSLQLSVDVKSLEFDKSHLHIVRNVIKVDKMHEADTVAVVQTKLYKELKLQADSSLQDFDKVL